MCYLKIRAIKMRRKLIGKVASFTHVGQDGDMFGHFCTLENVHVSMYFSVF